MKQRQNDEEKGAKTGHCRVSKQKNVTERERERERETERVQTLLGLLNGAVKGGGEFGPSTLAKVH